MAKAVQHDKVLRLVLRCDGGLKPGRKPGGPENFFSRLARANEPWPKAITSLPNRALCVLFIRIASLSSPLMARTESKGMKKCHKYHHCHSEENVRYTV